MDANLETKFGTLQIYINNAHSIFFESNSLTINGTLYRVSGHFESNGSEWKICNTFSVQKVNAVKHSDFSRSAYHKAMEEITAKAIPWLSSNVSALNDVQLLVNKETLQRLNDTLAIKQAEINQIHIRIAALEKEIDNA